MFTNLDHEITGEYYRKNKFFEEKVDYKMVIGVVAMIALGAIILLVMWVNG